MTAPKKVKVYEAQKPLRECKGLYNPDYSEPVILKKDHDQEIQALKADLEALVKMYSTKIKRNCQHDDPSWCNQFCNDYGDLARQIGDKNGIKYE